MSTRPARLKVVVLAVAVAILCLGLGALARAEPAQKGTIRVTFEGKLTPHTLPRTGNAPVRVSVGAHVASTNGTAPPQLRRISIAINRNGHFEPRGLPVCALQDIQPSTTADALAACRSSLVGEGNFSANVLFSQQSPFPSSGKLYAFNSVVHGRPAILAHVYGTKPVPTSLTLPFVLKPSKGTFGTVLTTDLPQVIGNSSYITGLSLSLGRNFSSQGHKRSYLSASCPAPRGFPGATFPFAKATFVFEGSSLSSTLTRSCRARG